ncbi:lipoprotein Spr [Sphingomonas sp. SORGH_AS802]|uniref:peptidoglycan endopeptidase n=1 Tax=unclassified Sphingomonas TaxID=196159 RepID=UPI0028634AB8|nr:MULTISPECIES: peptidoglycan endopeptidase [unclassified Sphingomonas]MDR6128707.1 lipoprotein Spr [Sphingomonas sp. SORGH_AS_0438]MDR6135098.1 lipoprotein Spr [Sphingomonas sp. SORGH_AS_0802]
MEGGAVVARARAALAVPFRLHGRDGAGLDCVGLAAHALRLEAPSGYPLRGGEPDLVRARLDAVLHRVEGPPVAGDLLMMRTGPGQLHLGIWTGAGLVHADAGLRRVVERPGAPPWPVLGCWRR